MRAIKTARKRIADQPQDAQNQTLARLVLSLESDHPFALNELYTLDFETFSLAIEVLREWRLDRYYAGKARLFDLSMQVHALGTQPNP